MLPIVETKACFALPADSDRSANVSSKTLALRRERQADLTNIFVTPPAF
jgi:hypothetical protein